MAVINVTLECGSLLPLLRSELARGAMQKSNKSVVVINGSKLPDLKRELATALQNNATKVLLPKHLIT